MRYELRCRECNKSWGNVPKSICEDCFSPLEVFYDYDSIRADFTREKIAQGPPNIWRYSALLPLPDHYQPTLPVEAGPMHHKTGHPFIFQQATKMLKQHVKFLQIIGPTQRIKKVSNIGGYYLSRRDGFFRLGLLEW